MYNIHSSGINVPKYKHNVYVEKQLTIETYIIGYKNEGEAILFFIRADGGISFSGLVDCFQTDDIHKVKEILERNGIQSLDFLCWTHPDLDHSKGLKEMVEDYTSSKTCIWIPEGVDVKEITCSKEVQKLFVQLKEQTMDSKANVYSASDRKDLLYYNSICFQKDTTMFPVEIISYAPNSKIIRRQNYIEKFIKNDRSIFFVTFVGAFLIK